MKLINLFFLTEPNKGKGREDSNSEENTDRRKWF